MSIVWALWCAFALLVLLFVGWVGTWTGQVRDPRVRANSSASSEEPYPGPDPAIEVLVTLLGRWLKTAIVVVGLVATVVTIDTVQVSQEELDDALIVAAERLDGSADDIDGQRIEVEMEVVLGRQLDVLEASTDQDDDTTRDIRSYVVIPEGEDIGDAGAVEDSAVAVCVTVSDSSGTTAEGHPLPSNASVSWSTSPC